MPSNAYTALELYIRKGKEKEEYLIAPFNMHVHVQSQSAN